MKFRDKILELLSEDDLFFGTDQLVYMYPPKGAHLQTGSRNIASNFVGLLVFNRPISPSQLILLTLDGVIFPYLTRRKITERIS